MQDNKKILKTFQVSKSSKSTLLTIWVVNLCITDVCICIGIYVIDEKSKNFIFMLWFRWKWLCAISMCSIHCQQDIKYIEDDDKLHVHTRTYMQFYNVVVNYIYMCKCCIYIYMYLYQKLLLTHLLLLILLYFSLFTRKNLIFVFIFIFIYFLLLFFPPNNSKDDPFSSLDNEVARHIFEQSVQRMLLKAKRTVILVTQQLQLTEQADYVSGNKLKMNNKKDIIRTNKKKLGKGEFLI